MEENKTPQQKYYESNKEKIAAQRKARYEANKELFKEKREENKEYQKKYREENKEKLSDYQKNYYDVNKETLLSNLKNYREKNKEKFKNKQKKYYNKNKEQIILKTKNYITNRLKNDPIYKFRARVRNLISSSINKRGGKKLTKSEIILGCTFDEFRAYIESKFEPWMTWDNYGNPKDGIYELNKTWDFDHIIPITQGMSELEIIKLNHYINIQPLCSYYNRWIKINN